MRLALLFPSVDLDITLCILVVDRIVVGNHIAAFWLGRAKQ
jgi:hypothetical protein